MILLVAIATTALSAASDLPMWEFDRPEDGAAWMANEHLADAGVVDGALVGTAIDWDPFFHCRDMDFEATPWQYVSIRLRADEPGMCDLFWSGTLEGEYGGLTQAKKCRFAVEGKGKWETITLFPGWHGEGRIRQLRLDTFAGVTIAVDRIAVCDWARGREPVSGVTEWVPDGKEAAWERIGNSETRFAPPLRVSTAENEWVTVWAEAGSETVVNLVWACDGVGGLQKEPVRLRRCGKPRAQNVTMGGLPGWRGNLLALGIEVPQKSSTRIARLAVVPKPRGAGRFDLTYFGFENAPNRVGQPCRVIARVQNLGGEAVLPGTARLKAPRSVEVGELVATGPQKSVEWGDYAEFAWEVTAKRARTYAFVVGFEGEGMPDQVKTKFSFARAANALQADYVPAPQAVETVIDVCAYYFPGWFNRSRWECIRNVGPVRKPVLGYYDEANPECVDWQIKWAVENGISCFLVDWYWCKGTQHLTHWFEAYRKARYRDELQVAIMWANHNAPGTHSAEDFRNVVQEWINQYFNLDSYYQINGKPAVFIWAPANIRRDLGGLEASAAAITDAQKAAQAAGYEGITFVALGYDFSRTNVGALLEEGYHGVTTYHEWGSGVGKTDEARRQSFKEVAQTAPNAWRKKQETAGELVYYPVVDTGWDSRPWHGEKSLVIAGRTPDLFEDLLVAAKGYCEDRGLTRVIVGPLNEWGEGSYIEPCTEFGFEMYERVRGVFGEGDPDEWPTNVAPTDVGLGPYDFEEGLTRTIWSFDDSLEGWQAAMNATGLVVEGGALRFETLSNDAALMVELREVDAGGYPFAEVRMAVDGGGEKDAVGQIFWSAGGQAVREATSVRFPVTADGVMRDYRVSLAENTRWRGRIATLRFDPCDIEGAKVAIEEVRLVEE